MVANNLMLRACCGASPAARIGTVFLAALTVTLTGCASFETPAGEPALFGRVGDCEALSVWVQPLSKRYGSSLRKLTELKARPKLAVIFEDEFFVPVFGSPIDSLSSRQSASISRALGKVRKRCEQGTYLRDEVPLFFLRDVFHPKPRMHASITREFANAHAATTRGSASSRIVNPTGADQRTIREVQSLLSRTGRKVGPIDGIAGDRTLQALRDYKRKSNINPADNSINRTLLVRLKRDADAIEKMPVEISPQAASDERTASRSKPTRRAQPASPQLQRMINELHDIQRDLYNPDGSLKQREVRSREGVAADSVAQDMSQLVQGKPVRLTKTNRPFLAGLSQAIMSKCAIPDSISERGRLTSFVGSTGASSILGNQFSNPDPLQVFSSIVEVNSRIAAGEVAGSRLGCGNDAKAVVDGVLRSLDG